MTTDVSRLTPQNALAALPESKTFVELLKHGTLVVEIYRPGDRDKQGIHNRDEVYVVISGQGRFRNGEHRHSFVAGETLFVPAGVEHRFEEFSDDFATWVFFYGPEGGEAGVVNAAEQSA